MIQDSGKFWNSSLFGIFRTMFSLILYCVFFRCTNSCFVLFFWFFFCIFDQGFLSGTLACFRTAWVWRGLNHFQLLTNIQTSMRWLTCIFNRSARNYQTVNRWALSPAEKLYLTECWQHFACWLYVGPYQFFTHKR